MSADSAAPRVEAIVDVRALRVFRYALGSTIAMAVAMGFDWTLSYLVPVLSLGFFATPDPCPTPKQGAAFIGVILLAIVAGLMLAKWLLPFPLVYVPFVGLVLFRIFYAKASGKSPLLITWLVIAVLVIPLVAMLSPGVAHLAARSIAIGVIISVLLVWLVYFFLPDPPGVAAVVLAASKPPAQQVPPPRQRFSIAAETTLVVLPVFILFYVLQWISSLLILIFIALLSSQPGFAKNYKAGGALILGNVIGGAVAIAIYELLVVVPEFAFLLMLILLAGLVFGAQVFSGKKTAALYGMAFSTVLLIIGSTTSGNAEAGAKVYTRVMQIMIAVVYVVVAFGTIDVFRRPKEA